MKLKFTLLLILSFSKILSQNGDDFIVNTYIIDSKLESAIINKTIRENFYEDEEFIVTKSCSGEFGGSIYFKDKKTLIEYECAAVCALIINKINNEYIVTTTLDHMIGFTNIFVIRNPRLLKKFKHREEKLIKYVGEDESKSIIGTRTILDSTRVLTLMSFPYKNKLYHIIDNGEIMLAEIINGKFNVIKSVMESTISYYDTVLINDKKHYILQIKNKNRKGYFDVFQNRIKIYWLE